MEYAKPKALEDCKTIVEFAYRHRYKVLKYSEQFVRTFGVPLSKFWENNLLGFDIVAFDEWLEAGTRGIKEVADEKYGDGAGDLVGKLL